MKVHYVKTARKPIPYAGVMVGDSYYWWQFRYGGKRVSKTYPKQSQLTSSEFLSNIYAMNERIEEITAENAADEVPQIIDELRDIANECEDKLSNMPDSLQGAPTGELLQQRADDVNSMADDLEAIDLECFEDEKKEEAVEEYEQWQSDRENVLEEIHSVSYSGE